MADQSHLKSRPDVSRLGISSDSLQQKEQQLYCVAAKFLPLRVTAFVFEGFHLAIVDLLKTREAP